MDSAVAENWEIFPQTDLCDFDTRQKIRFLWAIQYVGEGGENGFILMSIGSELRYCLRDQNIEPIKRLGLMGVDVIIGFGEYDWSCQARRMSKNVRGNPCL